MPVADGLRGIRLSPPPGTRGEAGGAGVAPDSEPDESMNSRLSWSVEGIDPSVRERAEAAARRAGMSLSDWLNSTIGDFALPNFRATLGQPTALPGREGPDVADIHQRLDAITRQIEKIARPTPRSDLPRNDGVRSEPAVARQLNDAISRLDARLSQISDPAPARQIKLQDEQRQADLVERAAAQVYRPSPPLSPASLDVAIAEIAARQSELDNPAPRPLPPRGAPPVVPATPTGPDFSALERHLVKITSQIEALQRPDGIEQSIATFRGELTEIRHAITEAMPRQAIESVENEIRSLSRRIDDTRQSGTDGEALAGIERALGEIREVLGSLKPAEQLAGYDEAIRNLGTKLDQILRANDDPSTVRQLENAIAALRSIVSNVASIAALTSTLESREPPVISESSEHLESALRALSDRLDRMPVGNDNASAFAHLEQRVSYLLERLEASTDHHTGNLGRVEDGLHDILRHLENQSASFAALTESSRRPAEPADSGLIDVVKRELSDIRFSPSENGRHTQDSLEVVHNTLGHVVDRLAMIEGDLRSVRVAPAAPPAETPPAPQPVPPQPATPLAAISPQPKPELPNPAAAQGHFAAAPREFQALQAPVPAIAAAAPRAISEILESHAAQPQAAIVPELPHDHPLEPGTRPSGRVPSPSERIAASESAISEITASAREQTSTSNFIAAARRAAQAAAAAPVGDKAARSPFKDPARDKTKETSAVTSKIRALLVGASVVVIVLSTFKMAMT